MWAWAAQAPRQSAKPWSWAGLWRSVQREWGQVGGAGAPRPLRSACALAALLACLPTNPYLLPPAPPPCSAPPRRPMLAACSATGGAGSAPCVMRDTTRLQMAPAPRCAPCCASPAARDAAPVLLVLPARPPRPPLPTTAKRAGSAACAHQRAVLCLLLMTPSPTSKSLPTPSLPFPPRP